MRLVAAFLALATAGAEAKADPATVVSAVWDRYIAVCGSAMRDAQAFVDGVSEWVPAGYHDTVTTEDGRMFKLNIALDDFFDSYSRTVHPQLGSEGCATHYNGMGIEDGTATARAFETLSRTKVPAQQIVGGQFAELYGGYRANEPLKRIEDNFQYFLSGVLDDPKLMTFVQIVGGFISMSTSRDIAMVN